MLLYPPEVGFVIQLLPTSSLSLLKTLKKKSEKQDLKGVFEKIIEVAYVLA